MTARLLATATRALRESGSREIPVAALRIGVIGQFRRLMIGIIVSVVTLPVWSYVFGLDSEPYWVELVAQMVLVSFVGLLTSMILIRTTKADPILDGVRSGLVVITSRGLRLFAGTGRRRVPSLALTLDLDDLVFAHIEPRRSIFDLPRFVFGHLGGTMSYEIAGKDVLQLRHAIERLDESADL